MDRAIVAAWHKLNDDLCPQCGRPSEIHKTDKPSDYLVAFYTCKATQALDDFQTKMRSAHPSLPPAALQEAKKDEQLRKAGYSPDRARSWFTIARSEGRPD